MTFRYVIYDVIRVCQSWDKDFNSQSLWVPITLFFLVVIRSANFLSIHSDPFFFYFVIYISIYSNININNIIW